ncbi:GNAT family N-acetyltransferase [Halobellus rufus]|uniref:GNAT family N-acetyltransferase n=1 Tax=Halobellus rufus TaxID=1448860 RepID=UPI0009DFFE0D|nr:GNAT family N-acetyltransferase [Halobellus rufus]
MIRPAQSSDLDALSSLQSYLDAPAPELLASVPTLGTCFVSVDLGVSTGRADPDTSTGRPVGYALVVGDAHLAELVVHPAYRREGRGRALLRALIADRAPGTRLTLTVAADNDAARSLYESVGFEAIGRQPDFFEIEADDQSAESARSVDAVVYAYEVPE